MHIKTLRIELRQNIPKILKLYPVYGKAEEFGLAPVIVGIQQLF